MSRDDLISINAKIVTGVTKSILQYTKNPIIIVDRPGHEINSLVGAHRQSQHVSVGFPSASTDVREAVEKGFYGIARRMVHYKVWEEIVEHDLYGHKGR
jgi:hypothetical protein